MVYTSFMFAARNSIKLLLLTLALFFRLLSFVSDKIVALLGDIEERIDQ